MPYFLKSAEEQEWVIGNSRTQPSGTGCFITKLKDPKFHLLTKPQDPPPPVPEPLNLLLEVRSECTLSTLAD